ncbi:hypothetical protein HED49_05545 [Ochrobactrum daejeonense]|nr:hypothetical protein [Brucella daejeonensis]
MHDLSEIDDHDIAGPGIDIDTVEITTQIAAGDELYEILVEPALGDELGRADIVLGIEAGSADLDRAERAALTAPVNW